MPTNNDINTGKPIEVSNGGTTKTSFTAYSVICGGTTTTNPLQNVTGVGNSGQSLTSMGAGTLPTWGGGAGAVVEIQTQMRTNVSSVVFTSGITATYNTYILLITGFTLNNNAASTPMLIRFSTDGGATYLNTNYTSGTTLSAFTAVGWVNSNFTTALIAVSKLSSSSRPQHMWINFYGLTSNIQPSMVIAGNALGLNGTRDNQDFSAGSYNSAIIVNALQITAQGGFLMTGRFTLFGIKES